MADTLNRISTELDVQTKNTSSAIAALEKRIERLSSALTKLESVVGPAISKMAEANAIMNDTQTQAKSATSSYNQAASAASKYGQAVSKAAKASNATKFQQAPNSSAWKSAMKDYSKWTTYGASSSLSKAPKTSGYAQMIAAQKASVKKASGMLGSVSQGAFMGTLSANFVAGIARLAAKAMRAVTQAVKQGIGDINDYIEQTNLFFVSLTETYAGSAVEFIDKLSTSLGINDGVLKELQGRLFMIGSSFGIAGDKAYELSEQVTKLTVDFASFYNQDYEHVQDNIIAGLVGQSRAMRKYGITVNAAAIAETALARGYQGSVRNLSEASKVQLRYITMMEQSKRQMNDTERTIETPANMMRIWNSQVEVLSRSFGSIFIPALQAVMPVVMAVTNVLTNMFNAIAKFFGFEMPEPEFSGMSYEMDDIEEAGDDFADSLDSAANSAARIKKYFSGMDELNVMTDASTGVGGGGSAVGSTSVDFDFDDVGYDNIIEDVKSKWQELSDMIQNSWFVKTFMPKVGNMFVKFGELVGTVISQLWTGFKRFFEETKLGQVIMLTLETAVDLVAKAFEWLNNRLKENAWLLESIGFILAPFIAYWVTFKGIPMILGSVGAALGKFFGIFKIGNGLFASFFKFLGGIPAFIKGIPAMINGIPALLGGIGTKIMVGIKAVGAAIAGLSAPVLIAVAAIALLAAGAWLLWENFGKVEKKVGAFKGVSEETAEKLGTFQEATDAASESLARFELTGMLDGTAQESLRTNVSGMISELHRLNEEEKAAALERLETERKMTGMSDEEYEKRKLSLTQFYDDKIAETGDMENRISEIYEKHMGDNNELTAEGLEEMAKIHKEAQETMERDFITNSEEHSAYLANKLHNDKITQRDTFSEILQEAKAHQKQMVADAESWRDGELQQLKRYNKNQTDEEKKAYAEREAEIERLYNGMMEEAEGYYDKVYDAGIAANAELEGEVDRHTGKVLNGFQKMWNNLKDEWGKWSENWSAGWTIIKDVAVQKVGEVVTWVSTKFNEFKDNARKALDDVKKFFSDTWDNIHTKAGNAWQKILDLFAKGGEIFDGIVGSISEVFKKLVNALIGGINKVIAMPFNSINGMLNKLRTTSFLGISPFKNMWQNNPLPVPQIPKLARGGMPDAGSMFIAGEAGAELIGSHKGKTTVMPLENTGFVEAMYDAVKAAVVSGMSNAEGQGGDVYVTLDGTIVGKASMRQANAYARRTGGR